MVERVTRGWGRWSELHGNGDGGSSYTGMGTRERVTRGWGRWSELRGAGTVERVTRGGDGGSNYTGTVERVRR